MEIQLQELIDQIKQDGVDAAESKAREIIHSAKVQAEQIVSDAKKQAENMISNAKAENERMVKSSEDAIRQAGRNLLISFRESVANELQKIIGENVASAYSAESLKQLIVKVVENWSQNADAEQITVFLNSGDLKALEETLLSALKDKLSKGVILKANDNFDGGFRISVNDSGAYYDYSHQAVVDMLSNYLAPKVTELLKEA